LRGKLRTFGCVDKLVEKTAPVGLIQTGALSRQDQRAVGSSNRTVACGTWKVAVFTQSFDILDRLEAGRL
jgi:hypothetical protein